MPRLCADDPLDFFTQIWYAAIEQRWEEMICADRAVQGVCVRALAMSGDMLFRFFEQFEKLL